MTAPHLTALQNPAPAEWEQVLDPRWLATALYPQHPDVTIDDVDIVWTLSNTATKIRAKLDLTNGPKGSPAAICIKGMFGQNAAPYRASGVSAKEVQFYQRLAGALGKTGMHLPVMLYGGIDEASGHGVLIMNDLVSEGCAFLEPLTPYNVDEAFSSVEQLARLHAAGYQTIPLADHGWVEPMLEHIAENSLVKIERLQELLADSRSDAFPEVMRDAQRVHGWLRLLADQWRGTPVTLVHGDVHSGNLYKLPESRGIGLIDWQLIQRGCWAQDVAYHLGAALSIEMRRAVERDLLDHYFNYLASSGGPRIEREEGWNNYRMAMLYGYYLWAITQRVDRPIILEFVQRLGTAVVDLDSFRLVEG